MGDWLSIILLCGLGAVLVIADLFLPSHFLLTLCAFGLFGYALFLTFQISEAAGFAGVIMLVVLIPSTIAAFLKIWPRTWIGRRIAVPNPVLSEQDRLPLAELERLVGATGRAMTPLRPVGTCAFDDRRYECVAERGMIASGVPVECIRVIDRTLCVRPLTASKSGA